MAESITGGCACGRVRDRAIIHDHDAYLCHCRMCQRSTGSNSIALVVKQADVLFEQQPDWYESSAIAVRPNCPGLMIASFDDPSLFQPSHSFGSKSMHRAWVDTDGMPEKRTEDYPALVEKWVEATGEFPG